MKKTARRLGPLRTIIKKAIAIRIKNFLRIIKKLNGLRASGSYNQIQKTQHIFKVAAAAIIKAATAGKKVNLAEIAILAARRTILAKQIITTTLQRKRKQTPI